LNFDRIKMSMLLDLDKDYLKDMEITLMGDIINILKHARVVANKNTSEMVLSDKVSTGTGRFNLPI
jgi:SAM domain (Sterile alpha motif)